MTSEMLSGPDLGAGYLHQLSIDRDEDRTTFTYHAQDGGADANGPPIGPLDAFGFVHPPTSCMFGGPRCWHRRFLAPFSETSRVRHAYNRNRFVLQTMLDQQYAEAPVAYEDALEEVLKRLSQPLAQDRIEFHVGGSMAARVLGAELAPRDVDLGTSREGVDRIAGLLAEFLIEPLAPTDWPRVGIVRASRAFVGTFQSGSRVEWSVPLEPHRETLFDEWTSGSRGVRAIDTTFRDHPVRVSRPEYALVRALEKHRPVEADAIRTVVHRIGPDGELLDALLQRSSLSEPDRRAARRDALSGFLG